MLGITFSWQPVPVELVVLTDSDWAGCKVTRRSTTGIVVKLGGQLLHFSSKLQKSICVVIWRSRAQCSGWRSHGWVGD